MAMPAVLRCHGTPQGPVVLPVTVIRLSMVLTAAIFGIVVITVDKDRQGLTTSASYAIPMQVALTMALVIRSLILLFMGTEYTM